MTTDRETGADGGKPSAKPTVKDIAAAAGVSPATVSNALNNRKGVSGEIRQRIMQTARDLGYGREPGYAKNVLRFVIFKRHGHIVSDTPFFSSLVEGMERQCRASGFELLVTHVSLADDDLAERIGSLEREYAGGIILLATEMKDEDMDLFRNVHVPMVILDNAFRSFRCDAVLIANADASWRAVSALVALGHASIGYLASAVPIRNFQERCRGFDEALVDHGIPCAGTCRFNLEPTAEGAYRDMKRLLEQPGVQLPTAFFADNDIIAFGAMKAMGEKGIRIPEDVSIIGFDDMPFCEMTTPRLSTVRVFKQEMGSLAVNRLLQMMAMPGQAPQRTEVDTELILRDSHAAPLNASNRKEH